MFYRKPVADGDDGDGTRGRPAPRDLFHIMPERTDMKQGRVMPGIAN